jgi:hypothetical protein
MVPDGTFLILHAPYVPSGIRAGKQLNFNTMPNHGTGRSYGPLFFPNSLVIYPRDGSCRNILILEVARVPLGTIRWVANGGGGGIS